MDEIDFFRQRYEIFPKQYISYQRAAYFGKEDADFRLTFDRALTGRRSDLSLRQQSYGDLLIPEQMCLMEVKISDSMPMWLAEELAKLQVYKTSFSKYGKAYQMYVQNQLEWTRPQLTIEKKGDVTIMLNTITNALTATSSELRSLLSNVTTTTSTTSVGDMLFALILGVVMGFLISLVYIFTHKKSGYTQSYAMTLLMLPPIVAIVLVMINSMASALSLAGVFTLCRYRTVPGDPKDITYVFFAMATGVICGINGGGHVWFVFVFFAVIAAVLILIEVLRYGICKTSSMTLKVTIPENLNYIGLFDDILAENTTSWHLKRVKTTNFGSLFELIYSIQLKNDVDQKKFMDEIRKRNGNLTVILSLYCYEDQVYDK